MEVVNITKGIDDVIRKGDFRIKHWVTNAKLTDVQECEKGNLILSHEEKVLGIWWNLQSDDLFLRAKVNFAKHSNYVTNENDMTSSNLIHTFPQFLTRRMVLSQVSRLFDPLGFLLSFLLKAKVLMRTRKSIQWIPGYTLYKKTNKNCSKLRLMSLIFRTFEKVTTLA